MVPTVHDVTRVISGGLVVLNQVSKGREISSAILANDIKNIHNLLIAEKNKKFLRGMIA